MNEELIWLKNWLIKWIKIQICTILIIHLNNRECLVDIPHNNRVDSHHNNQVDMTKIKCHFNPHRFYHVQNIPKVCFDNHWLNDWPNWIESGYRVVTEDVKGMNNDLRFVAHAHWVLNRKKDSMRGNIGERSEEWFIQLCCSVFWSLICSSTRIDSTFDSDSSYWISLFATKKEKQNFFGCFFLSLFSRLSLMSKFGDLNE